jgi:hypothetical protein
MTMAATQTNAPRIEGSGQTTDYTEHYKHVAHVSGGHVLRIHIHTDTCLAQAYGRVCRWDGAQWQPVAAVRGDALKVDRNIGYRSGTDRDRVTAYRADRDRLLALAVEVLG